LQAGAPVRPVAICFRYRDGTPTKAAAFVGAQSLLDSLLRVLRTPGLTCELTILPDIAPIGDRRALARRAEGAVTLATGVEHGSRSSRALAT